MTRLSLYLATFGLVALQLGQARAADKFQLKKDEQGFSIGRYLSVLEDSSGKLTIADVTDAARADQFKDVNVDAPAYGFSTSAFWVRVTVHNVREERIPWLLELTYPHLDWVDLYIPREDGSGYQLKQTGDHRPFAQRDVEHRNLVFRLSEPPGESIRTYYLRIQTSGSVNIPLFAWSPDGFYRAQNREQPVLWMFYGLVLVMTLYNAFIYFSVRERDYLYYCLYVVSYALFQFTLNGFTFQYLLPNDIWLSNQLLPCMIGMPFLWSMQFQRSYLRLNEDLPGVDRAMRVAVWLMGGLSLFGLLGPYKWSIRALIVTNLIVTVWLLVNAIILAARGQRAAQIYVVAWTLFRVCIFITSLKMAGALPDNFLTNYGIQIGASIEMLFFSLALADRINSMRDNLGQLNQQLTHNVVELREALTKAEAATVAKSNFLATVSHELRTPLNSIINIPQALLFDLPQLDVATCAHCKSMFETDPEETIDASTTCPDCQKVGGMQLTKRRTFRGNIEDLATNLGHIERSGKHLQQVVDGVLDFSRIEAERMELHREEIVVGKLLNDVVDPVGVAALNKGVRLELEPVPEGLVLACDPLRVRQVLLNLISNALKFSDGRGTVSVGVRTEESALVFHVRDQGIGIAAEDLPRLFRSFEQVHQGNTRKYGGTGLGLSISRSLVELHGGEIWVDSKLGEGSTFYFRIPFTARAATDAQQQLDADAPNATQVANDAPNEGALVYDLANVVPLAKGTPGMKKVGTPPVGEPGASALLRPVKRDRLLYVEDDDDNYRVAELRLREGYDLVRASNAEEVCKRLQQGDRAFTAVLMDIELRGSDLDGVELTKLLRGKLRRDSLPAYARDIEALEVPIIFVTAHGAKYSDAALVLAGAERVISKPVDFAALSLALTQLHLSRARQKTIRNQF